MATSEQLYGGSNPSQVEVGEKLDANLPVAMPSAEPKAVSDSFLEWVRKEVTDADKGHLADWRDTARTSQRFYAGHQMDPVDESLLRQMGRPHNAFNNIQKFIRFVSGVERRSPEQLIFRASEDAEDQDAAADSEAATFAYEWATRIGDESYETSRAFEDSLVAGIGCVDNWLNRLNGPKPVLDFQRCPIHEMLWPKSDRANLAGTRWRAREVHMSPKDVEARWPDSGMIAKSYASGSGFQGRPDPSKVNYVIPYVTTENYAGQSNKKKGKVAVLEFQWWDDEPGYDFLDPLDGQEAWLSEEDFDRYQRRLYLLRNAKQYRGLRQIEGEVERVQKIYRKTFLLERTHELGQSGRLTGNRFSFNFITGHWDEDREQWYGFIRVLMDPQRYANKFFNQMLEIIANQAKGGGLYEEGAIDNRHRREFEETYTKPGSWNVVARDAISQNRIQPKPLPQISPGTMEVLKFAQTAPEIITGLNPSGMGLDQGGNVPSVTMRQRQHAGLVLFSEEFDSLSKYRKEEGRIVLGFLRVIADGRPMNPATPYDPNIYKLDPRIFDREYDIYLDDTELDPSLRSQYQQMIVELAPTLYRTGNFLPEMWDYFMLPVKIRQKLKQGMIQKAEQAQQAIAAGMPPPGARGTPRDPKEQAAKIEKLQAEAALAAAKAQQVGQGKKIRDFSSLITALARSQKAQLEKAEVAQKLLHGEAMHHVERSKGIVETAAGILDVLRGPEPPPQSTGGA